MFARISKEWRAMKSISILVLGIVLSHPVLGLSSDEGKKPQPGEGLVRPKTVNRVITVGGPGTDLPGYTSRAKVSDRGKR